MWQIYFLYGKKSASAILSNYISSGRRNTLLKTFVDSEFGHYPLTWIINHILERAPRNIYKIQFTVLAFDEILKLIYSLKFMIELNSRLFLIF